jgi:hypothetical protein
MPKVEEFYHYKINKKDGAQRLRNFSHLKL